MDLEDGDWEFLLYAKQEDYSFSPDGTRYSYIDELRAVLCVGSVRRTKGAKDEAQLEEPHIVCRLPGLIAHELSPDGTQASVGCEDGSVYLVQVPSGPPLQTLPREELLARLRGMTNVRVFPDSRAPAGHRLAAEGFPGWRTTPTW